MYLCFTPSYYNGVSMIIIENYKKKFHDILFDNVNLNFIENGVYYLEGCNGVGKSTFLRSLVGLESFNGNIINKCKKKYFVFDDSPFYTNLSALDNIRILTSIYEIDLIKSIFTLYLNPNNIKTLVSKYSAGQRKILNLVILELLRPDLIILDEFKQYLDKENVIKFYDFLDKHKKNSIIFITGHDDELKKKSNYIYTAKDMNIILTNINKD